MVVIQLKYVFKMYCLVSYSSSYKQSVEELHVRLLKNAILLAVGSKNHELLLAVVSTGSRQRQSATLGVGRIFYCCTAHLTEV